jgi:hypothetical protein
LYTCECHRPFGYPRAATATTPKRGLVPANAVNEFDAGDRSGCVVERLEASHRGAAPRIASQYSTAFG